ncbi:triphosphoribosyl-dephospho-CoA synthase [Blastopirellula sp. JC732]|uniref:Triphosphoribosyl-dephospho-CoA synthase n=1 Tax=Blastopirellula sediminis TaxID=2894196 RepID=A0A9X1MNK4_9BACT|nr:triphosphoribosyl-dephospho-CoA synthase [Blastopirellula sediminis]MCC9608464.1 triphosphoribosyl-dephospho-CoA synthase [Blastopirellula sediminis]MCC9628759.1 triphosphoribosyl-dephospho-CoA synthase [Blastopirellula sediminis]
MSDDGLSDQRWSEMTIGQMATLACLLEVNAPKPGNVHRGADFHDLGLNDFAASAVAIGPAFEAAGRSRIGRTILTAIRATRRFVDSNTNLGLVMLLAPLATVPVRELNQAGVAARLADLNQDDAADVYQAIAIAQPGGLGHVDEMDVQDAPPADLLAAMKLAEGRDLVARQYVNGCEQVFAAVRFLTDPATAKLPLSDRIVHAHVRQMAAFPDSLIGRKCGEEIAQKSSLMASRVLDAGEPIDEEYFQELRNLDFWLRADGHRRNPGTSADIIGAAIFVALRQRKLTLPLRAL